MLARVAAIFAPTSPDFPRPVITTCPLHSVIISSAGFKFASSVLAKLLSAAISVFIALVAAASALDKSAIDHPINS